MMDKSVGLLQAQRFETSEGAQVFQIPLQAFPGLWGYAYFVLVIENTVPYSVLIDTGSGFGDSNQHLENGFHEISRMLGRKIGFQDLTHILITHGHIDHFGGLTFIRPRTHALLGVHELDLRNLTNYEERLTVVSHRLFAFLIEAGVTEERCRDLIEMYKITKSLYRSVPVDFTFERSGMRVGPFQVLHVPGHCAGHVVIRLHDILFSGDHVLSDITPHQSPEHLTLSTGLDHYLRSLDSLELWATGVRLTLGGHNMPIPDLATRISAIRQMHHDRLLQVLEILKEPHTIKEVSRELFGEVDGYNVLLALEETGAHIEFLDRRGLLGIENLDELQHNAGPSPIRYRCLPCGLDQPLTSQHLF
jgi:glyoxylase-like metal-dependent hydrolase (beta-lactamase superfamily II)